MLCSNLYIEKLKHDSDEWMTFHPESWIRRKHSNKPCTLLLQMWYWGAEELDRTLDGLVSASFVQGQHLKSLSIQSFPKSSFKFFRVFIKWKICVWKNKLFFVNINMKCESAYNKPRPLKPKYESKRLMVDSYYKQGISEFFLLG